MKKLLVFAVCCFMVSISSYGLCENWTGNTNLLYGLKYLEEDDWDHRDNHHEWGINIDLKKPNWPVSMVIGYLKSYGSELNETTPYLKATAATTEFDLGVRKIFTTRSVRPFISGGISYITAETEDIDINYDNKDDSYKPNPQNYDDDGNTGFWIDAGIFAPIIIDYFNIGLAVKWSTAEVTINGVDVEAGGTQIIFLTGLHW